MITIHTVQKNNSGKDKNTGKKNISLFSFLTIFNNIKGKKSKKDKKHRTYIRIRGRERQKNRGKQKRKHLNRTQGEEGEGWWLYFFKEKRKHGREGEKAPWPWSRATTPHPGIVGRPCLPRQPGRHRSIPP